MRTAQQRRDAFLRGSEALHGEQVDQYGPLAAWSDQVGAYARTTYDRPSLDGLSSELAGLGYEQSTWDYLTVSDETGGYCTTSVADSGVETDDTRKHLTESEVYNIAWLGDRTEREPSTLGMERLTPRTTIAAREHKPGKLIPSTLVPDREARELERLADDLLRAAGFDHGRVTAWEDHTRFADEPMLLAVVAPDRVAYRGQARYAQRNHAYRQPSPVFVVDSVGQITACKRVRPSSTTYHGDGTATVRYQTKRLGRTPGPIDGRSLSARYWHREAEPLDVGTVPVASGQWDGYTFGAVSTERAKRAVAKVARVKVPGAGRRGPVVSPWLVSERNLIARWKSATVDQMATAALILDRLTHDGKITAGGHTHHVVGGKIRGHDQTFTLKAFARRAALAGLVID